MRLMPRHDVYPLLCSYVEPRFVGSTLMVSVFLICLCPCQVAIRRWYASLLYDLIQLLWFSISHAWFRDPVGDPRAKSPSNDIKRFFSERRSSQNHFEE